ncbi:hypothetical protein [Roseimaritima sediminicola]|uniref:hypothetical protein n=1 Tax=Roseimaritima sediminicola TaxID=2662066 RepID=UPI001F202032|nr:hypothetical protein [Roseimaritima sediminicola]
MAERLDPQEARDVEFFQAMENGDIDVKFIPRNAAEANVIIKNKTDKPLHIRLPDAFAGVPVNAQFGGMGGMGMGGMGGGMGMGGMGGMGGGMGMGQAMGGGMGGMGGMGGGMGMGGMGGGMGMGMGAMRIAPEKVRKLAVTTVCLEHGKPDPTPKMAYKIVPLDVVTKDERVASLCSMLGRRQIAQNTAQAATWHLTDGLKWRELAAKNRVESRYSGNVPFFTPVELRQAMTVVNYVTSQAADPSGQSESDSDSETTAADRYNTASAADQG